MNLIEIKILFNTDHPFYIKNTRDEVQQFINTMLQRPEVIQISKTRIAEGGGDDSERQE